MSIATTILVCVVSLIILAIALYLLIYYTRLEPVAKQEADDFLNGIIDVVYTHIKEELDKKKESINIEEILTVDITSNNINQSMDTVVNILLKSLYDSTVDIVLEEVEKNRNHNFITFIIYKHLTRERIEKFVSECFDMYEVKIELNNICVEAVKNSFDEEEKLNDEYEKMFSGPDYVENSEDVPLQPVQSLEETLNDPLIPQEEKDKIQEELDSIIPPKEEESEEYDEIIEEKEFFYDSKGRKRDKKTGRYAK